MKRFMGWVVLAARLHRSLCAVRSAISQVGRRPIPIRPARTLTGGTAARNLPRQHERGLPLCP
jgi:hypothetical protein